MKDNIQYAEIRPNFITSNQLYHDDSTGPINNWGIIKIIIDEVEGFQADMARGNKFFGSLKVIYCTPRSFSPKEVKAALDECIEFKKRWPQWIAGKLILQKPPLFYLALLILLISLGFDLVSEEGKGWPLKNFLSEFLDFQERYRMETLEIPFLD
jgi:adenosine deaminase CECR1